MPSKHIICLTPDQNLIQTAIFAAKRLLTLGLDPSVDVAIVCTENDINQETLLGSDSRVQLITNGFELSGQLSLAALPLGRHLTIAAYRRLLLAHILPAQYARIVYLDCDTLCVREGINELFSLDLKGRAFAAALDMILLKDFENGPLTEQFQRYRTSLGLKFSAPYFNSGVLLIDRKQWLAEMITDRALAFARAFPDRCQFHDQSALNAVSGNQWLPLSPRFNFMGDFLLLDLMEEIKPIILHFVNDPKPWQKERWKGPAWIQAIYESENFGMPFPKEAALSPTFMRFREKLLDFLARQEFVDSYRISQA